MQRRRILRLFGYATMALFSYAVFKNLFHLTARPPRLVLVPFTELERLKSQLYLGEDFLLVKREGHFLAFDRRCPHLGCKLNFEPTTEQIVCPCHGSRFTLFGKYLSGPAKRHLWSLKALVSEKGVTVEVPF